jgi:hypothetical protein
MWGVKALYAQIRKLEGGGNEQSRVLLARFVAAVLALIGLEILLVLWLYELPARPTAFGGGSGLLAPSILLTHPKGPRSLLLIMVGVAIATTCRDLAELTRNRADPQVFELRRSVTHAYAFPGSRQL